MNVIEAVRKATDPYGMDGERTASMRPSASEVIDRLAKLGFKVEPITQPKLPRLEGIEQYQVESR